MFELTTVMTQLFFEYTKPSGTYFTIYDHIICSLFYGNVLLLTRLLVPLITVVTMIIGFQHII